MHWPINNLFPTSVGINTFVTIMLLALTTNCDGGVLRTTQRTHICLILFLITFLSRCFYQSKHEAGHGPMAHKEGDGPASECKIA